MSSLTFEGYVIVSADGMLTDASGEMPSSLDFPGDKSFLSAALDRVDLIVHGRKSHEHQPTSARRRRLIVTRQIGRLSPDPDEARATLWNPAGCSFFEACAELGVSSGSVAVIGGPDVFAMFLDRYDTFWLSQAPRVYLRGGRGCFPGVPARSPQNVLAAHGLVAGDAQILDAEHDVRVTPWRRGQSGDARA